jgi:DNA-binding CsgD family transcriptional regulator
MPAISDCRCRGGAVAKLGIPTEERTAADMKVYVWSTGDEGAQSKCIIRAIMRGDVIGSFEWEGDESNCSHYALMLRARPTECRTLGWRRRRLRADDYVVKPINFDVLHTIITSRLASAARNEIRTKLIDFELLNTIMSSRLVSSGRNQNWPKPTPLSDREIEMLTWVARGKTSLQISAMLGLAKRTIEFHLDSARGKLGAVTRTEAVIKAAFERLIEP